MPRLQQRPVRRISGSADMWCPSARWGHWGCPGSVYIVWAPRRRLLCAASRLMRQLLPACKDPGAQAITKCARVRPVSLS